MREASELRHGRTERPPLVLPGSEHPPGPSEGSLPATIDLLGAAHQHVAFPAVEAFCIENVAGVAERHSKHLNNFIQILSAAGYVPLSALLRAWSSFIKLMSGMSADTVGDSLPGDSTSHPQDMRARRPSKAETFVHSRCQM